MRFSNVLQWAAAAVTALSPTTNAAFLSRGGNNLYIVIGTRFTQQNLNALWDAGVTNIPIDLVGSVFDDLYWRFGRDAFGYGIPGTVRYTERALSSGAQGFFSVMIRFPSSYFADKAYDQINAYVRRWYKRDVKESDFFSVTNFTVIADTSPFSPTIFGPEGAVNERFVDVDLGKRDGNPNTVCKSPRHYDYIHTVFNTNNPGRENFNQCESCYGGSRDGC